MIAAQRVIAFRRAIRVFKLMKIARLLVVIENDRLVKLGEFGHSSKNDLWSLYFDLWFCLGSPNGRASLFKDQSTKLKVLNQLNTSITFSIASASTSTSSFVL